MTAQVSAIAKKCRRALRNETGIKFTLDELRALVDIGSYDLIMQAEAEEIRQTWQKTPHRSLSGNTGSTTGGTAKPEMRSAARRVGKECVSTGESRGSAAL